MAGNPQKPPSKSSAVFFPVPRSAFGVIIDKILATVNKFDSDESILIPSLSSNPSEHTQAYKRNREEAFASVQPLHPDLKFDISLGTPPPSKLSRVNPLINAKQNVDVSGRQITQEEGDLNEFHSHMIRLYRNFARNFVIFHQNVSILQELKQRDSQGLSIVKKCLSAYSFRYRDALVCAFNELLAKEMHYRLPQQMQILEDVIQFFDMFQIVLLLHPVELIGNLMLWFKIYIGNNQDLMLLEKSKHLVDQILDGDQSKESLKALEDILCRLLCHAEFEGWIQSVSRLYSYQPEVLKFLERIQRESRDAQINVFNYKWDHIKYVDAMYRIQTITESFLRETPLSPESVLSKSLKLLVGDRFVAEVCSENWREFFVCQLYWAAIRTTFHVSHHWQMFCASMMSSIKDATLCPLDHIIFCLWSNQDIAKISKILIEDRSLETEFGRTGSFLLPHLVDVLFMTGTFNDTEPESGAPLWVETLSRFALSLQNGELEPLSFFYLKEANTHPRGRQIVVQACRDYLSDASRKLEDFIVFSEFLMKMKLFGDDEGIALSLSIECLEPKLQDLCKEGKLHEALYFAVHTQKRIEDFHLKQGDSSRRYRFLSYFLQELCRKEISQCEALFDVFHQNLPRLLELLPLGNCRIYSFFVLLSSVRTFLQEFLLICSSSDLKKSQKEDWIECNLAKIRNSCFILFRLIMGIDQLTLSDPGTPIEMLPFLLNEIHQVLKVAVEFIEYGILASREICSFIYRWRLCTDQLMRAYPEHPICVDGKEIQEIEKILLQFSGRFFEKDADEHCVDSGLVSNMNQHLYILCGEEML